jgi:hypothetical protein
MAVFRRSWRVGRGGNPIAEISHLFGRIPPLLFLPAVDHRLTAI